MLQQMLTSNPESVCKNPLRVEVTIVFLDWQVSTTESLLLSALTFKRLWCSHHDIEGT